MNNRRWLLPALAVLALSAAPVRADEGVRANAAREATTELDLARAHELLDRAGGEPAIFLERARLALYEGNYDAAAVILARPELARTDAGAELAAIANGCARATAAAVSVTDEQHGVFVRLQDEDDRPLVPLLVEVATAARESLARDLKVDLPRPLRIELVRDLFTLAVMTGLPESAAQTTGTVAVAKWGRVTMISPRAIAHGYPWADTLAHEMAHLAQTRASGDRAPLWLQEGVAKREETRWRAPRPFDDFPGADAVAAAGLDKGLGRPIDKLGASIAMLPSADQAMVAFAEVTSFVRFWVRETGDPALPELLVKLRSSDGPDAVDHAMVELTGASLADWNARWLSSLKNGRQKLPADMSLAGGVPHEAEIRRDLTLGELLRARGHHESAAKLLGTAQKLAPFDPLLRHHLASALYALGQPARKEEADALIGHLEDVHSEYGPFWALHARKLAEGATAEAKEQAEKAFQAGIWQSPLTPEVACHEKLPPEVPDSATLGPLCQAARNTPQD